MKKLIGKTVRVDKASGEWANFYIGKVGIVEGLCRLYKGAVIVRFDNWFCASFYPIELEVKVS